MTAQERLNRWTILEILFATSTFQNYSMLEYVLILA